MTKATISLEGNLMKPNAIMFVGALTLLSMLGGGLLRADEGQIAGMINDLQKQITDMQKTIAQQNATIAKQDDKLRQIQGGNVQMAAPASGEATPPMSDYEFNERLGNALGGANKWLKDLKFKGDLRLRYEAFDYTNGTTAESDSQNRFRFRLRFGFEKKLSDEMDVGFALASGATSSGTNVDPTSTNATFDNLFNFKDIMIEKAYAKYSPKFMQVGPIEKVTIAGGKFDNPFEKGSSDMIWDRDVKPEGVYEKIDLNVLDGEEIDINAYGLAGQFVLDEDTAASDDADAELYAFQVGVNAIAYTPFMERPIDFLSAFSFYNYNDYHLNGNYLIGTTSLARGNSNYDGVTGSLDSRFNVIESYNELAFYPMGVPLRPYFDVAVNTTADSANTQYDEGLAWALGTKVGGIQKKGDWELSYAYKRIEANSVVGAFNDSDFGTGHSNKRGSVFKAGYGLTDFLSLNAAAFFVNNLTTGTAGVRDEETRRFQMDLVWKF
ncbi:MAG: putative porin [Candidatus Omnitrophota bacterium]